MICAKSIQLLAAADSNLPTLPSGLDRAAQKALGGTSAIMVAVVLIFGLVLIWAVFIRKPERSSERGRLTDASAGSSGRRRRRRQSRQRNPTLAETGGLPPIGSGNSGEINSPRT